MTAVDTNPLLEMEGLPKFKSIEAENLTPAVEKLLEKLEKDFKEMEEDLSKAETGVSFDDVVSRTERVRTLERRSRTKTSAFACVLPSLVILTQ